MLRAQPGVQAAYAGANDEGALAAVVQIEPGRADEDIIDRLNAILRAELPSFLVLESVAVVQDLQMTLNGKVDVTALIRDAAAAGEGTGIRPSPSSDSDSLLSRVCSVWTSVLGVAANDHSDFFESGGDSVTVLRLLTKCREEFGAEILPVALFDHPTPGEFTVMLADLMWAGDGQG